MSMKFDLCDDLFAKYEGRSLSPRITKYNVNKKINYDSFADLFYTCVSSVLLYASTTCGIKNFKKCDQIQHRA